MFGIFERPLFLELCKHMETVQVAAGQYLFRIGNSQFYEFRNNIIDWRALSQRVVPHIFRGSGRKLLCRTKWKIKRFYHGV